MKSQAFILQFVLFFLIGIIVFTTFTNFFTSFGTLSSIDIKTQYVKYVNKYLECVTFFSFLKCRECKNFTFRVVEGIKPKLSKRPEFSFLIDKGKMKVFAGPEVNFESNLYNLNYTIDISGIGTSTLPIIINYEENIKLEIKNGV